MLNIITTLTGNFQTKMILRRGISLTTEGPPKNRMA